jgi:hypothetical protein
MGDNGSPYLRLLKCLNHLPLVPFTKTKEEAVERRMETQARHLGPNPNCCSTSKRKSHHTESKALAMSRFKNRSGCLLLCKDLIMP